MINFLSCDISCTVACSHNLEACVGGCKVFNEEVVTIGSVINCLSHGVVI